MKHLSIFRRIFGRKFYLAVVNQTGTNICFVNSTPFCSRRELSDYIDSLDGNGSFSFVESVTFRSRLPYEAGEHKGQKLFLISNHNRPS